MTADRALPAIAFNGGVPQYRWQVWTQGVRSREEIERDAHNLPPPPSPLTRDFSQARGTWSAVCRDDDGRILSYDNRQDAVDERDRRNASKPPGVEHHFLVKVTVTQELDD